MHAVSPSSEATLAQAHRLSEPGAVPPAPAGPDARALAWALKDICYQSWSTEPPRAARAAHALRGLLDAGVPADQSTEIEALAQWTEGIALVTRGQIQDATVVCHIGASSTNIVVSADNVSQFTRLVGLGGVDLTNAVADQTGLAPHEAEALKAACGLLGDVPAGWDQATVTRVRHALALAVRPLVQEIGRTIDFYRSQEFSRPVEHLVLSGGTALCAGLDRYVSQALGINVEIGDPLQNLAKDADLAPDVATRSAVAQHMLAWPDQRPEETTNLVTDLIWRGIGC